jgi:branched-chain amino acid transport system substrate-binding protein
VAKLKHRHLLAVLVLTTALGILTTLAAQAETVKIGLIGSLTGPHSGWDVPASEGLRMAVSEINAAGGFTVAGKRYSFAIVEEDAQSKPDAAAAAAQKLLSDDDIHAVFGVLTSTPGMAAAVPIGKAKVLYVGGFTSLDTLIGTPGHELFLRALDSDAIAAGPFVQEVVKEFGVKKIGMLLPNEDVSKSIVKTYQPLFEKAGVQVLMVEYFQPGTTDFAPVLRKFQRQGLDGLFIGYSDPDAEAIVRQSLEVGDLPTRFIYRGGSGAPAAKYASRIDGFAWQILTRDLDTASDPKVKGWIDRYKAFTKKDVTPTTYWALAFYDTLFMLARAMEAADSVTDAKAIASKLQGMHYDGVRAMNFDAQGHARTDIDIGFIKGRKAYSSPAHIQ